MSSEKEKILRLIHAWMNFKSEKKDLTHYKEVLGDNIFHEYEQILDETSKLEIPRKRSKAALWDEIEAQMDVSTPKQKVRFISIKYISGIAASLLFLLVSAYLIFFYQVPIEVTSTKNYTKHILPDQSEVMLNAQSSITYMRSWKERELDLEGEAFFKVTRGERFTINTKRGKVEILGTTFNVYARDNQFVVSCKSGKVRVSANNESLVIQGGEQASATEDASLVVEKLTNAAQIGSWQNGQFYFKKNKIEDVFKEIERQFDVKIEYKTNQEDARTYTGYFSVADGLSEALDNICTPFSLTYRTEGKTVYIE